MQYTYTFTGRVYPERVHFSLSGLPAITFEHSDFPIKGSLHITIQDCAVEVRFISNDPISHNTTPNIYTLKNVLEDLVRTFIDIFCYVHSYSYDLDLEKVTCDQLQLDFTFSVVGEFNITPQKDQLNTIAKVYLSGKYPFLPYVLADFRRSIKYPSMTAGFCYRAIETIRQAYFGIYNAQQGSRDYMKEREQQSWANFNETLGFTESDHRGIVVFAKKNRHGEYPAITYTQREMFMNHTREVISRFIKML